MSYALNTSEGLKCLPVLLSNDCIPQVSEYIYLLFPKNYGTDVRTRFCCLWFKGSLNFRWKYHVNIPENKLHFLVQIFYAELTVAQYFIGLFWKLFLTAMTITICRYGGFFMVLVLIFLKTVSYFLKYVWFQ